MTHWNIQYHIPLDRWDIHKPMSTADW